MAAAEAVAGEEVGRHGADHGQEGRGADHDGEAVPEIGAVARAHPGVGELAPVGRGRQRVGVLEDLGRGPERHRGHPQERPAGHHRVGDHEQEQRRAPDVVQPEPGRPHQNSSRSRWRRRAVGRGDERQDEREPQDRDGGGVAEVEGVPVEGPLVDVGRHGLGRPERPAAGHDPDQVEDHHLADEGEDQQVDHGRPQHRQDDVDQSGRASRNCRARRRRARRPAGRAAPPGRRSC